MDLRVAAIRSEQWRKTVYECVNRSPYVSKKQWCRENAVNYRSLMHWQRKFQLEAIDLMDSCKASLPDTPAAAGVPAFADMSSQLEALRSEQEPSLRGEVPVAPAPELVIQTGAFRIYVNSSVQETTLATVMKVIRHA